jgi:hypothetical protein
MVQVRRSRKHGSQESERDTVDRAIDLVRRQIRRWRVHLCLALFCWTGGIVGLVAALRIAASDGEASLLPLLIGLCCVAMGAVVLSRSGAEETSLTDMTDVRAIGPLLEALDAMPDSHAQAIRTALTDLLPRLTAADARFLNPGHRGRLHESLLFVDADRNADYLLAILLALEQIGAEEALRPVRKLAERAAVTPQQQRISAAAAICLQQMETRLEQGRERATQQHGALPATAALNESTELLRPPINTAETLPETLVRPAVEDER